MNWSVDMEDFVASGTECGTWLEATTYFTQPQNDTKNTAKIQSKHLTSELETILQKKYCSRLKCSSNSALVVGSHRSGRTSLLWQYACNIAKQGGNVRSFHNFFQNYFLDFTTHVTYALKKTGFVCRKSPNRKR